MKEKNLPQDYDRNSLEELTEKVNRIIKALENEKNLNNSVERYQDLIKLNNIIEKKFQKSLKLISKNTNSKIKEIAKKNEK
ncbi:exonuclease VII small subunit [Candidatus Pelagibacter sp.]|nr:exonuclease VII small subunit [Candidatus Pelagibacter sp.]|tara:strand:- start:266 stop:508 length:243 start_codon:yes stop_codon:yes gene_type:complete